MNSLPGWFTRSSNWTNQSKATDWPRISISFRNPSHIPSPLSLTFLFGPTELSETIACHLFGFLGNCDYDFDSASILHFCFERCSPGISNGDGEKQISSMNKNSLLFCMFSVLPPNLCNRFRLWYSLLPNFSPDRFLFNTSDSLVVHSEARNGTQKGLVSQIVLPDACQVCGFGIEGRRSESSFFEHAVTSIKWSGSNAGIFTTRYSFQHDF